MNPLRTEHGPGWQSRLVPLLLGSGLQEFPSGVGSVGSLTDGTLGNTPGTTVWKLKDKVHLNLQSLKAKWCVTLETGGGWTSEQKSNVMVTAGRGLSS